MWSRLRDNWISFINRPILVMWCCAFVLFVSLLLDGSLYRLWRLRMDLQKMQSNIESVEKATEHLEKKLKQAQSPEFIEHQARDRFDYVGEHDLVFIFSDEG